MVDKINDYMILKLSGQETVYKSFDTVNKEDYKYPTEFLNTLMPSGMPPHILKLKVGAPILLLRNLDPRNGHCNGSKYIVSNLLPNVIEAINMTPGPHCNKKLLIPRIPLCPASNIFPFDMTRKQFPVRLAFAITANKAQGQTLQKVGLYLDKPFFSHGQLYVAMSRAGSPHGLKIVIDGSSTGETNNVVYKEIFQ
jgi:ATP-dependent DNA helicase PIF1